MAVRTAQICLFCHSLCSLTKVVTWSRVQLIAPGTEAVLIIIGPCYLSARAFQKLRTPLISFERKTKLFCCRNYFRYDEKAAAVSSLFGLLVPVRHSIELWWIHKTSFGFAGYLSQLLPSYSCGTEISLNSFTFLVKP